jgi:hypothetical protein
MERRSISSGTIMTSDRKHQLQCIRIDVLITVTMKSTVFWNVTPYSPVEDYLGVSEERSKSKPCKQRASDKQREAPAWRTVRWFRGTHFGDHWVVKKSEFPEKGRACCVPLSSCAVTCTSTLQTLVTTTVWKVNPLKSRVHFWWDPVYGAFICYTV